MSDGWESAITGMGSYVTPPLGSPVTKVYSESDEHLRGRLLYIMGDAFYKLLAQCSGPQLDAIAADYGLRRLENGK